MPDDRCEGLREPIAELALGIASGEQRARVLEHANACPSCQRLLSELALVSDERLQLAPEQEPPPGFEVRVLERVGRGNARRPFALPWLRGRRVVALAAAAAALAAGAGAAAALNA